jgi:acetyl-CoA carboxylase biotin carboxyl carrier protein
MDIKEIQNLIKFVAKSGAYEVEIEKKDFKITIKTSNSDLRNSVPKAESFPVDQTISNDQDIHLIKSEDTKTVIDIENDKYIVIKSPIIGTFYRKSGPDKPLFLEVGSEIKKGETMCVIEAMKLFNEIESEMNCKIIKILVDDETPVEFDQPLFLVDPI